MQLGKPILYTLIYYVATAALITYIEASGSFRSGPCTPNFDILAPVLLFGVSCILLIANVYRAISRRGDYVIVAAIHAFVIIGIILFLVITANTKKG
ncbi:MAG: hypothetical protein V4592_05685 [Bacteroidota bacterium]